MGKVTIDNEIAEARASGAGVVFAKNGTMTLGGLIGPTAKGGLLTAAAAARDQLGIARPEDQQLARANSKSHLAAWAQFTRAMQSQGKFHSSLNGWRKQGLRGMGLGADFDNIPIHENICTCDQVGTPPTSKTSSTCGSLRERI